MFHFCLWWFMMMMMMMMMMMRRRRRRRRSSSSMASVLPFLASRLTQTTSVPPPSRVKPWARRPLCLGDPVGHDFDEHSPLTKIRVPLFRICFRKMDFELSRVLDLFSTYKDHSSCQSFGLLVCSRYRNWGSFCTPPKFEHCAFPSVSQVWTCPGESRESQNSGSCCHRWLWLLSTPKQRTHLVGKNPVWIGICDGHTTWNLQYLESIWWVGLCTQFASQSLCCHCRSCCPCHRRWHPDSGHWTKCFSVGNSALVLLGSLNGRILVQSALADSSSIGTWYHAHS